MSLLRPADVVVVAAAALLVGMAWAALWTGGGTASFARITVPGIAERKVSLAHDHMLEVEGRLGTSRLEVRDGRVRFIDSPCAGRLCVHAGWLWRSGHVAACLPNGIVVELDGEEREFDALSF